MRQELAASRESSGRRFWFVTVGALVSGALLVDIGVLAAALTSATHFEEERPYEHGLRYQQDLDSIARLNEQPWKLHLAVEPAQAQGLYRISAAIVSAEGRVIPAATRIAIRFERPADERADRSGNLEWDGVARFTGSFKLSGRGLWRVELRFSLDGKEFLYRKLLFLDA